MTSIPTGKTHRETVYQDEAVVVLGYEWLFVNFDMSGGL